MAVANRPAVRGTQAIPKGVDEARDELLVAYFQGILSERKTGEHAEEARAEQGRRNMRGRQVRTQRSARLLRLSSQLTLTQ